jgi:A/G-specific adenine glycosylase
MLRNGLKQNAMAKMEERQAEHLVAWYSVHKRDLPWRNQRDPYAIWLSEVILQQTRVQQGLAYYQRFLEAFPTVEILAESPIDKVLKCWEGLGYYRRAHLLHAGAQQIVAQYGGNFPQTHTELEKLKGIGPYTARAVASLAFGERVAVVDGNVFRVLSRFYADDTPIDTPKSRAHYQPLADRWVQRADPADVNQGLMELGATICTPTKPACAQCPLLGDCQSAAKGDMETRPVKSAKAPKPTRYYKFYWCEDDAGRVYVRQRPAKGLWSGLWELPNEQVEKPSRKQALATLKHIFTHFEMNIQLYIGPNNIKQDYPNGRWVPRAELRQLALPRAISLLLDQLEGPATLF